MDKILFCQGGLGDHLSLSTLPEELTKLGHDVYVSYSNVHRNPEIYNLVWGINPYIKGFSYAEPNCGLSGKQLINKSRDYSTGYIEQIEAYNEILNTGNKYPKIYRQNGIITDLIDKTILNLESISADYSENDVLNKVNKIITDNNINSDDILMIKTIKDTNVFGGNFADKKEIKYIDLGYEKYFINDIFHYCDVINSCKNYITLHSGGASLASAIGKRNTYVIMNDDLIETYNKNRFIYDNQNYIF